MWASSRDRRDLSRPIPAESITPSTPAGALSRRSSPMAEKKTVCPDCSANDTAAFDRRSFFYHVGHTAAVAVATGGLPLAAEAAPTPNSAAETAVKALYEMLTEAQKKVVCFDWDH